MIEYMTVSRCVPSRRRMCDRNTPSFTAPIRSIAVCERTFRISVFNCTRRHPSTSKACFNKRYLHSVFTAVRHTALPSHVLPISSRRSGADTSKYVVVPTASPVASDTTAKVSTSPRSRSACCVSMRPRNTSTAFSFAPPKCVHTSSSAAWRTSDSM
jgi:hypothetical protein